MKQCVKCLRDTKKIKRGYCNTCYEYLRRNKLIEIVKEPTPDNLSTDQYQHLIGSLLGDGCLMLDKKAANSRLSIARKSDDIEYLKWQASVFQDLCKQNSVKFKSIFDKRTQKTYNQCYFRTRNCHVFNDYHHSWYNDGKKIIPRNINLTPLILLIWFLDDGHMAVTKNNRLKIALSTDGFSKDDSKFLADELVKLTGYYFGVHKSRNSFMIQGGDGAARAFANIINNIYPECMLRKANWRKPEVRFNDPSLHIYKSKGKRLK